MADSDRILISPDDATQFLRPVAMPTPAAVAVDTPVTDDRIVLSPDQVAFTPYEDPEAVKVAARLGTGSDKKPVLDLQVTDNPTRILAQLLFDDPDEKMEFLRQNLSSDYDIGPGPDALEPNNFSIKKKGRNYWGVLDPAKLTFPELIKEAAEHSTEIAQMLAIPEGPLSAALVSGSIQAVRQGVKDLMLPGSFNISDVALDTAVGGAVGGGGAAAVRMMSGAKDAAVEAGKKGVAAGKNVVARSADSTMWDRVKKIPSYFDSPEWELKEYGGTAKEFNDFQKKSLTENIEFLRKASPEYAEARKAYTLKGKYEKLQQLTADTGKKIGEAFNDPDKFVTTDDIFATDAFQKLTKAATTRVIDKGKQVVKVNANTQKKIDLVLKDQLEQLATMVFPEGKSANNILNLFRKGKLAEQDIAKSMGAKTNNEAMMLLLRGKKIPMDEAWMMRIGTDEAVKYGQAKQVIASLSSARKLVPDSLRDAMETSLRKQMDPAAAEELIGQSKIYHNLLPVVSRLSNTVARGKTGTWNPLTTLPGSILSKGRFAVTLGRNLINKPEVTAFINSGGFAQLLAGKEADAAIDVAKTSGMKLGKFIRAGQFAGLNQTLRKNVMEEPDYTGDVQQGKLLPRDASAYLNNPELFRQMHSVIQESGTTDLMVRQLERGDNENFANTLSTIASENADLFEPAQYNSLVHLDGKAIIQDKYDREAYRTYLEKNFPDPAERFAAMQMLNTSNEMIKAPFALPQPITIKPAKSTTVVGRVADSLKKADLVDTGNGTERQDYDY